MILGLGVESEDIREVVVRSVERNSAQGREKYEHNGIKVRKTKAKNAGHASIFYPDLHSNKLRTGFGQEIENPWKVAKNSKAKPKGLGSEWIDMNIHHEDYITLQTYLEIKHGVKPGVYDTIAPDVTDNEGAIPTFLQKFRYILKEGANFIKLGNPRGELAYYAILNDPFVATDINAVIPGKHLFYISKRNENEERMLKKQDILDAAIHRRYRLFNEMTYDIRYKLGIILGLYRGDVNDEKVRAEIVSYMSSPKNQIENITEFNRFFDLVSSTDKDKMVFEGHYFMTQLLNARIILEKSGSYVWLKAPSQELKNLLTGTRVALVEWILDPKNEDYKKLLKEQLKEDGTTGLIT